MSESKKDTLDEMFGESTSPQHSAETSKEEEPQEESAEVEVSEQETVETDQAESAPDETVEAPKTNPTELKANAEKFKPKSETSEEMMLRFLLTERNPALLEKSLAEGKTIRGAWNYVVSVMKNVYIAQHGRVNGGCVGSPDIVCGIAERYFREFPEGSIEPEVAHTTSVPKKIETPRMPTPSTPKEEKKARKARVVSAVKRAAKAAKKEAEQSSPALNTNDASLDKYDFSSLF